MSAPEYLICLNCESPCYVFEWEDSEGVTEALCTVCGADNPDEFVSQEDFDALASG